MNIRSDSTKVDEFFKYHYLQTHSRIPPYIIGILLGWILHQIKNKNIYINGVIEFLSCIFR